MIERARQGGISFTQIGKALGLTRQAVHARMRRARAGPIAVGALLGYNDLTDAILSLLA
jgi:DNA-binding Lrp family transcriptional regulator